MSVDMMVTFPNPRNRSGVSHRERIPPSAKKMEAQSGHILKRKKTEEKQNMSPVCQCGVIWKSLQSSFDSKRQTMF